MQSLILYFFPGLLIALLLNKRIKVDFLQTLCFSVVFSIGINGLLFTILRNFHFYSFEIIQIYIVLLYLILIALLWKKRNTFIKTNLNILKFDSKQILYLILILFTLISLYYSVFFPPRAYDSYFYHLTIAKTSAEGTYFRYVYEQNGDISWIFKTFPQNVEMFLSPFFLFKSKLYSLFPPITGLVFLLMVYFLGKTLNLSDKTSIIAVFLGAISPIVMYQSGDYWVDLLIGIYLLSFAILFIHYAQTESLLILISAVSCLAFAVLSRYQALHYTMFLFTVGFLVIIFGFLKKNKPQSLHWISKFTKHYGYALFALVLLIIIPLMSREHLNEVGEGFYGRKPMTFVWFKKACLIIIENIFKPGEHGLVFIVVVTYLVFLIFNLRRKLDWKIYFIYFLSLSWLSMILIGAIFVIRRQDSCAFSGRYMFPAYPFMLIGSSLIIEKTIQKISWLKNRGLWRKINLIAGTCLIIISMIVVFNRDIAVKIKRSGRGYVIAADTLLPFYSILRTMFNRYGYITFHPFESTSTKLRWLYGDSFKAWEYINSVASEKDNILIDEQRFMLLKPFCYDAKSPGNLRSIPEMIEWIKSKRIRYILRSKRPHFFEAYNPFIIDFVNTSMVTLKYENSQWIVYEVKV